MKKKGFTLVELLVVIAIIALLMGILMPALARVRQIAYRLYCGTNLSGIGKAMLIYSQDYDDELPRAGASNQGWSAPIANWASTAGSANAFQNGSSISSCFYLLIKFAEVTPKSFLCKGDSDVKLFDPAEHGVQNRNIVDLWDFGQVDTQEHCSYAYHNPYPDLGQNPPLGYTLTSSSDPGMAVAGDPNPWQYTWRDDYRQWADYQSGWNGSKTEIQKGNSVTHQEDGQNVLFVDGHTNFEKDSRAGVDQDNVYTRWDCAYNAQPTDVQRQLGFNGTNQTAATIIPRGRTDTVLMTDNRASSGTGR
jgi:prepilin-type N-terminal cleavage/methylation domain-containing protein/prepilin-type processing-associated H-X9-DG protein